MKTPPFTFDHPSCNSFEHGAALALNDENLQTQLGRITREGFQQKRKDAISRLDENEFDKLRDRAREIKNHALENLDAYLEIFEQNVIAAGGRVHWAADGNEAAEIILGICKNAGAKTVTKGKSMVSEEIGLNHYLEKNSIRAVETDLGEYILQLRNEPPSHIIAPAFHIARSEVENVFREHHAGLDNTRDISRPEDLLNEARQMLRRDFISADVGITGANMLVAETGTALIVTNEGNGDLTQNLPGIHIAISSIEKIVPTLEDASTLLRVLARSATGQDITVYTTFFTGSARPGDLDGAREFHIVLLDGARTKMLGSEFRDVLRCIRCGSCMNHCPVFGAVGGHAYGWIYPGPIGSVLNPWMLGPGQADTLPEASTLCGRCEAVCPVRIPLPDLLRRHRTRAYERGRGGFLMRFALGLWSRIAATPVLYHAILAFKVRAWKAIAGGRGAFRRFPFLSGWTKSRDFPAPQGRTFMDMWREKNR